MSEPPYIQSVVAPVCSYSESDGSTSVQQIHGTGFFVTNDGVFITARHVIEGALADAEEHSHKIGIFPMQPIGGKATSLTAPILDYQFADEPFDIAICRTPYKSATFFRLQDRTVEVWQDIATTGYPISVTHKGAFQFEVQQRAHKGYIQRKMPSGRLKLGRHPDAFELSFPITHGLSGSPLFIHEGSFELVIGVCVGSYSSRVVDYESVVIQEGSVESREQVMRVEEFGIAHDIRPLLGWKPRCLAGQSLIEASNRVWGLT